jgi:hypothetical protein
MRRKQVRERRAKEMQIQMRSLQLKQQAKQLEEQASVQGHLAANAMRVEANRASTNSMINNITGGHRIDPYTVEYLNSSVSASGRRDRCTRITDEK